MSKTNGSFKTGIKYVNWKKKSDEDGDNNYFYHLFGGVPTKSGVPLQEYWKHQHINGLTNKTMQEACYPENIILDKNLSPKCYQGIRSTYYAWHFDAHQVADFLKNWSINEGVVHVVDDIVDVSKNNSGEISSVVLKDRSLSADIY